MSHLRPWYIKVNCRIKTFVASKNVNILILQTVLNIFTITSLYSYVLSIKCNIRRKKQICILKVFSVIRKFWLLLLSIWRPWCHAVFNHLSFEVNLDREHYVLQIMHQKLFYNRNAFLYLCYINVNSKLKHTIKGVVLFPFSQSPIRLKLY